MWVIVAFFDARHSLQLWFLSETWLVKKKQRSGVCKTVTVDKIRLAGGIRYSVVVRSSGGLGPLSFAG